ncbi:MAG: cytochrome P450 [Actinomycetota bacterium]
MASFVSGPVDPEVQRRGDESLFEVFASARGLADPNPFYRTLREEAPVHISGFGGTVFSRYADCRAILRDNRFGNGPGGGRSDRSFGSGDEAAFAYRRAQEEARSGEPMSMLRLDPPDHTRQRSLVSRAFTPRRVERLRPRIAELVEERLDALADAGTGDAMTLLAEPLPVSVISEMLGVPQSDWPEIRDLVTDLVQSLEPSASVEELKLSDAAAEQLWAYFRQLIAARRADPQDDLLTGLIQARDDGSDPEHTGEPMLSEGEILAVANLLFAAGAETTTNLIGNGLNALFNHPDQLDALWSDPELVPTAVDEILRFDSPVQVDGRMCLEEAEVFGVRFEPGDRLLTLLGAANRDPEVFEDPDGFDVTRRGEPVMSFASGIHYCLGANLAKVEGQEVFAGLIRRFGRIEPAGDRPYRKRLVLRGLASCPVTVTAR